MRLVVTAVAALVFAAACSSDEPEAVQASGKPIHLYCYKSLAGIECFDQPFQRDSARLVSFAGPDPSLYAKPSKPPVPPLKAPKPISYWVKDPEPIPTAKVYLAPAGSERAEATVTRRPLPPAR